MAERKGIDARSEVSERDMGWKPMLLALARDSRLMVVLLAMSHFFLPASFAITWK